MSRGRQVLLLALLAGCVQPSEPPLAVGGNYVADMSLDFNQILPDDGLPVWHAEWPTQPLWIAQTGHSVAWSGYPGWAESDRIVFEVDFDDYSYAEFFAAWFHLHLDGVADMESAEFHFQQDWYAVGSTEPRTTYVWTYRWWNIEPGTWVDHSEALMAQ